MTVLLIFNGAGAGAVGLPADGPLQSRLLGANASRAKVLDRGDSRVVVLDSGKTRAKVL